MGQQTRGDLTVRRFGFDQGARRQNGGFEDFVHRYAVVQVLDGFFQDEVGVDLVRQVLASLGNGGAQLSQIERAFDAVVGNVERALLGRRLEIGRAHV